MPLDTILLREYREALEQSYCNALINLLKAGRALDVEQFVAQGLPRESQDFLTRRFQRYSLDETAEVLKHEICHYLYSYLQVAIQIRDQKIKLVGQIILEQERLRLGLMTATAKAINQVILPPAPSAASATAASADPAKIARYDAALRQAIQQDCRPSPDHHQPDLTPLSLTSQVELRLLQRWLEIADSEIPPANRLWTARGTDYITLWRLLKRKDWRGANQETLRLMQNNNAAAERDPKRIDLQCIPLVDLQSIDLLWAEASSGRFGFLAQLEVWREEFSSLTLPDLNDQVVGQLTERFGRRVDWRRNDIWIDYQFVNFSLEAAKGHLPTFPQIGWWCWARRQQLLMDCIGLLKPLPPVKPSKSKRHSNGWLSAILNSLLGLAGLNLTLG
ncbi:MAG: GUN4 domain-containing protein [Pegethrix bostrychoides GSE-TBD4-15B]|jgi:hypothetical protein|uniref:GUN4 domain-containing protein n=1 Tax=Pegethrix bostrychoides GSE-TBD4-15B TaxID=2839662 RepID=A0A951P9K3_9CYAN|nr:GUN4 domain-containing protein [Pegethrix bostrychoides GSE-TBD4-15B]